MALLTTFILLVSASSPSPLLTDTRTLANIISLPETAASVQIIDTRGESAYAGGHIPGAIPFNPADFGETRDGIPNVLKSDETLAGLLAEAGIRPDRQIIIYHEMDDPGQLKTATRMFWVLDYLSYPHVSLLDGGLAKWRAENRPIETTAPERPAWDREAIISAIKPRGEIYASREEVSALAESGAGLILDNRSQAEYTGESKGATVKRGGHIPGAQNLPAVDLLENTGTNEKPVYTFRKPDELRGLLGQFHADLPADAPVVTYCNTGMSASAGYFGFRLGGFENVSMYEKSMSEWANEESLPIETGEHDR